MLSSPRRGGNTEIFLNKVIEGIEIENCPVETVNLNDYPIKPIQDCEKCMQQGRCTINGSDNYDLLIQKFLEADCVLFASPTYWYSVSAQMKSFIDRWSCSLRMLPGFKEKIRGKKAAIITVHGEDDPTVTKQLFSQLQRSFQYMGLDFIGKVQGKAQARGEINNNKKALERAYQLGVSIGKKKYFSEK